MKHRRTQKHKRHTKRSHHSRRKTSRRITKRNRGGAVNRCYNYEDKLQEYKDKLNEQTVRTIEDFNGKVRALYDRAQRAGCSAQLLREIEDFENGPVLAKANSLLRV